MKTLSVFISMQTIRKSLNTIWELQHAKGKQVQGFKILVEPGFNGYLLSSKNLREITLQRW